MTRVIGALSLLTGVLLGLGATAPLGGRWMVIAALLGIAGGCTRWRREPWMTITASTLAGMVLATLPVQRWESLRLPDPVADARGLFEGKVVRVPERDGAALNLELRGHFVAGIPHDARPRRLRLQWRNSGVQPRVGETWRLLVRQEPLETTRNFEGMDIARLAFRDGIHAAGRVIESSLNAPLAMASPSVHRTRARLAARISDAIADPDAAALVTALAVGLTGDMSADQWRVFNATGTTHLVAISGLHVTLFAWLAFRVARGLWGWLPLGALERDPFAWCLGLAAAGGYAWLAGFSIPTQRTWLMLSVYVVARLACRHVGAGRLWSMALVLVLLCDPLAPLSAGFWLSFIAVGVLMLSGVESPEHRSIGQWSWSLARLQIAVMLALAPLTMAVFGTVSIVGLVVNLVAIPVISFLFVPLVLAGASVSWLSPALGEALFAAAAMLYEVSWPALVWCADLPRAAWRLHPEPAWYLLALPATLIGLCRWPWALRLTVAGTAIPLLFALPDRPAAGEARVVILDAGRGSAIWVETRSHGLVFDTGDAWGTRGGRLRRIVLPLLDSTGANVDRLVLPALDADRAAAAALLAFERGARRVIVGGGWPGGRLDAERCADSRWTWDGVAFESLAAGPAGRYCLLRVAAGGGSLLIPGDVDSAAEHSLLARLDPAALASDVAIMSRQASDTGSSAKWIEAVSPGLAIATGGIEGARSRERVIDRWRRADARVIDTRRVGAVELRLGSDGVKIEAVASVDRYPFVWRRPLRYSPRHVGNSESRRPVHVADHPVFHPAGGDRARAPLDAPAQARAASGAHQEGDAAG